MQHDFDRLAQDLRDARRAVAKAVPSIVRTAAASIERDAKAHVPIDTGHLRSSIGRDVAVAAGVAHAEIGPTADYGLFVELGTSKTAPQPYMGPASERGFEQFDRAISVLVRDL